MTKKVILIVVSVILLSGGYFVFVRKNVIEVGENITVANVKKEVSKKIKSSEPVGQITGEECATPERRPYAVMLAGDRETRPLSGISQADLVIEMPVAPNSITRFMAVYQCETPKEIGSVRSSRMDFIPLAGAFKAIYAHWGGEKDALDKLNRKVLNNIDALHYDGTIYYRKSNLPRPHNGFTTLANLEAQAKRLGYSFDSRFSGYPHTSASSVKKDPNVSSTISASYPSPFGVTWKYDPATKTYKRWRNGTAEIDRNTGQQVTSKVVVLMHTTTRFLRDQYIEVKTEGGGAAEIYQGGNLIRGAWSKDAKSLTSKLIFKDSEGKEIKFVPGKIWIQIVTN